MARCLSGDTGFDRLFQESTGHYDTSYFETRQVLVAIKNEDTPALFPVTIADRSKRDKSLE